LKNYDSKSNTRLGDVFTLLPVNEFCVFTSSETESGKQMFYQVLGKKYQDTTPLSLVLSSLLNYENEYGERARLAKTNEGVDWKAVSHALRATYQIKDIFLNGDIVLPFEG